MFLTSDIPLIFSDFCYITKYWNSDRFKLLALGICFICKVSLNDSCKSHGSSSVKGLYALCSTLIKEVRVAGNMNSTELKFKKLYKKIYMISCFTPPSPTWSTMIFSLLLPTPSNLTWLMDASTVNFRSDCSQTLPEHIKPEVLSESYEHTFAASGLAWLP